MTESGAKFLFRINIFEYFATALGYKKEIREFECFGIVI